MVKNQSLFLGSHVIKIIIETMKRMCTWSAREQMLIYRYRPEMMKPLKGFQRTREGTLDAAGHVIEGVGQVITGTNGRLRGLGKIGLGILDFADTGVSALADGVRSLSGMPSNGTSGKFNITRAAMDIKNIRGDDVMHTIQDTIAYTTGLAHAVLFKPGSDILRAFSKP
jgi:hypothetical protein